MFSEATRIDKVIMTKTIVAIALIFWVANSALCQEASDDSDPSKVVFFSIREEYSNLQGGNWANSFILRKDTAILKHSAFIRPKGMILRWDLPVKSVHAGSETKSGLGDLYTHALIFPRSGPSFTFGFGPALVLPTATDGLLGTGKWQFAPLAVPIWYISKGRGFFAIKIQDFISFAGDQDRSDFHYLQITPTVFWRLNRKYWILADTEATTNWKSDRTALKSGLLFGRVLSKRFAFWVKPEIPWGSNRTGDLNIKCTFLWIK